MKRSLLALATLTILPIMGMDLIKKEEIANMQIQNQIDPAETCFVCLSQAGELDSDKIFSTTCCKQFFCHDCHLGLLRHALEKNCPHCRRTEWSITKATKSPFPIHDLPANVKILILQKIARMQTDLGDQASYDSYKGIISLSLTNKELHTFINNMDVINELMKCFEYKICSAAILGIPGSIEWIRRSQTTTDYIASLFLENLNIYIDEQQSAPHFWAYWINKQSFSKALVIGLMKSSKPISIHSGSTNARWGEILRKLINIKWGPWTEAIQKKVLTNNLDAISLSIMLEESIKMGATYIVYDLLEHPNLDINKGIEKTDRSNDLRFTGFNLPYEYKLSDSQDTPLIQAVKKNKYNIVHLLLSHSNIDKNKRVNGKSALGIALEIRNEFFETRGYKFPYYERDQILNRMIISELHPDFKGI